MVQKLMGNSCSQPDLNELITVIVHMAALSIHNFSLSNTSVYDQIAAKLMTSAAAVHY